MGQLREIFDRSRHGMTIGEYERLDSLGSAIDAAESRIGYLNRWLESRGLPLTWTGPLDAWGWVLYDELGNVAGYDHKTTGRHRPETRY